MNETLALFSFGAWFGKEWYIAESPAKTIALLSPTVQSKKQLPTGVIELRREIYQQGSFFKEI